MMPELQLLRKKAVLRRWLLALPSTGKTCRARQAQDPQPMHFVPNLLVYRLSPPLSPPVRCGRTHSSQHPAEVEAEAFNEALDGISARVRFVSVSRRNIYIYIQPWRLFAGLSDNTVAALGLVRTKGVMVRCDSNCRSQEERYFRRE